MKIRRSWCDDAFVSAVLFLSTGAFVTVFLSGYSQEAYAQGSPMMQVCWSCIYLAGLVRAHAIRRRLISVLKKNPALIALLALAALSFCWSLDPGLTLRRSLALLLCTLFAVDFGVRYPVEKQVYLISWTLGVAIVLSAIAGLFFPQLVPAAPWTTPGDDTAAWHGLFSHKNIFGEILAFGVLCAICRERRGTAGYTAAGICLAGLFALILASQSGTALLISALMILQWPLLCILHWRRRMLGTLGVAGIVLAVFCLAICVANSGTVASTMDRSTDLTGRTELWQYALQSAAKRPVLGYGYNGFWGVSQDSARISDLVGWSVPYAHNGLLDIDLQFGLTGLLLFLGLTFAALARAVRFARQERTAQSLWPLCCLLLVLYNSATESNLLAANSFTWIVFVSALVSPVAGLRRTETNSARQPMDLPVQGTEGAAYA